jgi:hypothetical protein
VDVLFVCEAARRSHSDVRRDDGVTLRVPGNSFNDVGRMLPHDLAHLIVERGLGLEHGFWGTVASGGVFSGMRVLDGRRPPHAGERSRDVIRANAGTQELTQAEVLVAVACRIAREERDVDRRAVLQLAGPHWAPDPAVLDAIPAICAELREAAERWCELPIGGALAYEWPVARRRASRDTDRTRLAERHTSPPRSRRPERSR